MKVEVKSIGYGFRVALKHFHVADAVFPAIVIALLARIEGLRGAVVVGLESIQVLGILGAGQLNYPFLEK